MSTGDSYKLVASAVHAGVQCGGHYAAFTLHKKEWRFRDDECDSRMQEIANPASHYFLAYVKMTA
jgi:ubiquitin C-terminal hydrolase|tara:strand:- start:952 stop:1146 length:195 start_codon:yes stop_codon:yes gene_type:complete